MCRKLWSWQAMWVGTTPMWACMWAACGRMSLWRSCLGWSAPHALLSACRPAADHTPFPRGDCAAQHVQYD